MALNLASTAANQVIKPKGYATFNIVNEISPEFLYRAGDAVIYVMAPGAYYLSFGTAYINQATQNVLPSALVPTVNNVQVAMASPVIPVITDFPLTFKSGDALRFQNISGQDTTPFPFADTSGYVQLWMVLKKREGRGA